MGDPVRIIVVLNISLTPSLCFNPPPHPIHPNQDKTQLGDGAIYVRMPRLANGQRICYYHNVGKCTNAVCPFVHVLVRRWALPFWCLLLGGGVIVS